MIFLSSACRAPAARARSAPFSWKPTTAPALPAASPRSGWAGGLRKPCRIRTSVGATAGGDGEEALDLRVQDLGLLAHLRGQPAGALEGGGGRDGGPRRGSEGDQFIERVDRKSTRLNSSH